MTIQTALNVRNRSFPDVESDPLPPRLPSAFLGDAATCHVRNRHPDAEIAAPLCGESRQPMACTVHRHVSC